MFGRIGHERGWPPVTRRQYEAGRSLRGALLVGNAEKIILEHEFFKNDRFLMQIDMGALPHSKTLRAIELLGTKVKPIVDRDLAV